MTPQPGDWITWMHRTAIVRVVRVRRGFVTTAGKPGVSSLEWAASSVRAVVARQPFASVHPAPARLGVT